MTYRNAKYELLALGPWDLEHVQMEYDPNNWLSLAPDVLEQTRQVCQSMREKGKRVEPNPLYRYVSHEAKGDGLLLKTGAVDYESYLGLSHLPNQPPAVVVTVSAITEVEGHLVLERRSSQVAQGPGMLHVKPSGHIHPPQTPWQAVLAESEEELAMQPAEIEGGQCLGFLRSLTAPCVAFVYRYRTNLTWSEMSSRKPVDSWEHDELLLLPMEPTAMAAWLIDTFQKKATGPGHASVLLEGRALFGDDWFREVWRNFA